MPLCAPVFQIGRGVRAESRSHGLRHVAIRFKAALADAGADGGQNPIGFCAVQPLHLPDGFFQNPGGTAPPSGVDRAHAARVRVVEQDDAAIGGKNRQRQIFHVGDQCVGSVVPVPPKAHSRAFLRYLQHGCLVNLLG